MKPVLIYIHGGAWKFGDSTDRFYGPDFLLSQDNVVVTIQYRLGMFGLLNLGTSEYSGNMALKDQQLAFKWVWNNIANFAGDKQKILLFGESSGALNENKKNSKHFIFAIEENGKSSFRWFSRSLAYAKQGMNVMKIL